MNKPDRPTFKHLLWLTWGVSFVLIVWCSMQALWKMHHIRHEAASMHAGTYAARLARQFDNMGFTALDTPAGLAQVNAIFHRRMERFPDIDELVLHDRTGNQPLMRSLRNSAQAVPDSSVVFTLPLANTGHEPFWISVRVSDRLRLNDWLQITLIALCLLSATSLLMVEALYFSLERGPWQRERTMRRLIVSACHGQFNRLWKSTRRNDADLRPQMLTGMMLTLIDRYERVVRLAQSQARTETSSERQQMLRALPDLVRADDTFDTPQRIARVSASVACYHRFSAVLHAALWSGTAFALLQPTPLALGALGFGVVLGALGRFRLGTLYALLLAALLLTLLGITAASPPPLPQILLGMAATLGARVALALDQRNPLSQRHERLSVCRGVALGALVIGPVFGVFAATLLHANDRVVLLWLLLAIALVLMLHAALPVAAYVPLPMRRVRRTELLSVLLVGLGTGLILQTVYYQFSSADRIAVRDAAIAVLFFCTWLGLYQTRRLSLYHVLALALLTLLWSTTQHPIPPLTALALWLGMRGRSCLYRRPGTPFLLLLCLDWLCTSAALLWPALLHLGTPPAALMIKRDLFELIALSAGVLLLCAGWLHTRLAGRPHALA
ncbi:hypothetical protein [Paraburkholderia hayleyella]|uniref:hypothetical protein n=1 Tax=Paraburkholderia hayleyella TaxID=2152889 RepID=UPI0012926826|nr:hypothetical protein [Paraburkholderia hayleyella]